MDEMQSHESLSDKGHHERVSLAMLTPSWLSGLLAVVVSLAVIVVAMVAFTLPSSSLYGLLQEQPADSDLNSSSRVIQDELSVNVIMSYIPLLLFWGAVGFIVYSFVINLMGAFQSAIDLKNEMEFVHANRRQLIRRAILKLGLRAVVLVVWLLFILASLNLFLPYSIAAVQFASGPTTLLNRFAYALLGFAILVITLHIHTILLRLLRLRARLFGQVD